MADNESVNRLSFENFEFISLHGYLGDTRKVTKKEHLLNARQEQLFLPEAGALIMCFMGERNGRSRISGNCFHWWSKAQGTSITLIEFAVSEDDIDITSCCVFDLDKCRGSSLFPLQGSKVLAIPEKNTPDQEDHGLKFLLWGE